MVLTDEASFRARTFANGFGSVTTLMLDLTKGANGYPNLGPTGLPSASSTYDLNLYATEKAFDGVTFSWVG